MIIVAATSQDYGGPGARLEIRLANIHMAGVSVRVRLKGEASGSGYCILGDGSEAWGIRMVLAKVRHHCDELLY